MNKNTHLKSLTLTWIAIDGISSSRRVDDDFRCQREHVDVVPVQTSELAIVPTEDKTTEQAA